MAGLSTGKRVAILATDGFITYPRVQRGARGASTPVAAICHGPWALIIAATCAAAK